MGRISVIIPTLGKSRLLPDIRKNLSRASNVLEVIIVSPKGILIDLIYDREVHVFSSKDGRGFALLAGSREAKGEILIFLHDDTLLPKQWEKSLLHAFTDPELVGGAFRMRFQPEPSLLFLLRKISNLYTRLTHEFWGDHALFIQRRVLLGKLEILETPLMEDIRLSSFMREKGKTILLPEYVLTDSKKFLQNGILRQSLRNVYYRAIYGLGASPNQLFFRYYPEKKTS